MEAIRKPLSEITQPSRNVAVVVTLDSLLPETTSISGIVKYQRLLFKDKAGTEIPVTFFYEDIALFSEKFHVGRDYDITDAVITPIREDVRRGSQLFQMIIRSTTKVVELAPSNVVTPSYIVPLDSATEYVEHQGRIDVIGLALHVTSPRKVRPKRRDTEFDARDIVLIDRSMKPSMLTVWQAFVSVEAQAISDIVVVHPTVLVTRVSASKFRGGSWNTTFFSTIQLDYDGPEAITLRQWETENAVEIARIDTDLESNVGENSRTILPIAALGFQEDGATVWIKGKVTYVINPDSCERLSLVSDFIDNMSGRLFTIKLLAKQFGDSNKQLRFSAQYVEEIEE
ncbi:replication protein A 70 kDa DNA-binding subunit B-like [Silene latifolia]|uniref:replication protein A 70 kDa DNA-binding subunit B-like n=1 Tax=Silene latifolia TaxID=37657 RepID=UPI003D78745F